MTKKILIVTLILLTLGIPQVVKSATLYLMPQRQTVYQGDSFLVEVRLDTGGEDINTVSVNLVFPDSLEVIDFSQGSSILTLWPQKPEVITNQFSFAGGIPQGFTGQGLLLKITLSAKDLGQATVSFKEDSKVLLNDGKATELSLNFWEGNYEIIEKFDVPVITSRTHPDQNKWYSKNTLHLKWDLVEGREYSFLLTHDPLAEPDEIADRPEGDLLWLGDMNYTNLESGIYYFHLREKKESDQWGSKITFRAMIDLELPEPFEIDIVQEPTVFEGKYFLSFNTKDEMSGIDHYEISEIKDEQIDVWEIGESPYLLKDQRLESNILVKAVDKAGNERTVKIIPSKKPFPYWIIGIALLIGGGVAWWIWRKVIQATRNKKQERNF